MRIIGLRAKSNAMSAIVISVTFLLLGTTGYVLRDLRVGGPLYGQIIIGKDILADILPPPEYIIEPFLEATLALNDPSSLDARKARLSELEAAYNDRASYWGQQALDPAVAAALTERIHVPAREFWLVLKDEFLPALAVRNEAAVESSYKKLTMAYSTHRQEINELVERANRFVAETEATAERQTALLTSIIVLASVVMLLAVLAAATAVSRSLVKPLVGLTSNMLALKGGRHDFPLPSATRLDEIGDMQRALIAFRDAGLEKLQLEREAEEARQHAERDRHERDAEREKRDRQESSMRQAAQAAQELHAAEKAREALEAQAAITHLGSGLARLASGDLRTTISEPFAPTFEQLRADFNDAVRTLGATIQRIVDGASRITSQTGELAAAAEDLARRTETQAASIEQSSAAVKELYTAVQLAADSATKTKDMISIAKTESNNGAEIIRHSNTAMAGIRDSSQQISRIIGVVDEIAYQTNLLALNAGVEAARAGDAGRGFAVVANEVRALAQRSAGAAKEIKALITRSSSEVEGGFQRVSETENAIGRILQQVCMIDEGIAEIATRAVMQSSTLKQVNLAIGEIEQTTQRNASMAEEATAACKSLTVECTDLSEMLSAFQVDQHAGASRAAKASHRDNMNAGLKSPFQKAG